MYINGHFEASIVGAGCRSRSACPYPSGAHHVPRPWRFWTIHRWTVQSSEGRDADVVVGLIPSGYVKMRIENGPFIGDLPIKHCDFPYLFKLLEGSTFEEFASSKSFSSNIWTLSWGYSPSTVGTQENEGFRLELCFDSHVVDAKNPGISLAHPATSATESQSLWFGERGRIGGVAGRSAKPVMPKCFGQMGRWMAFPDPDADIIGWFQLHHGIQR